MSELTAADRAWNRATERKRHGRPGDAALSALLSAHGLVMNGGVLHCVELLSEEELREAIAGYRYFGVEVGPVFQRAKAARPEETRELESTLDEQYERIADDGRLMAAFQAHYAEHPEAYESS
ncbi:MAG TPA: hypothetical protein VJ726_08555 [Candidatus Limnocylindria bacterium]|nr:hypothetical protein [Candidatus Limnocylindria bacterium]